MISDFRKLALSFKDTEELPHFDKSSFRINKKIFATLNEKENRATVKLSGTDQYIFCLTDKTIVYPVPNKWGLQGWTHIDLNKISKKLLVQILKSSYKEVASKNKLQKRKEFKRTVSYSFIKQFIKMINQFIRSDSLKPAILLTIMSLFCFLLSLTRVLFTGTGEYLFLNWNLFLAFIPWMISIAIVFKESFQKNILILAALVSVWLLFFPNSPYILTDLFHLRDRGNAPVWFDLIIILSFGWTGLLFGFHSLMNIETLLSKKLNPLIIRIVTVFLFFAGSFGVYLGRYQRWNSWDIIHNPLSLLGDVAERFIDPLAHPRTWGVTILLGILLNLMYISLKIFTVKKYIVR